MATDPTGTIEVTSWRTIFAGAGTRSNPSAPCRRLLSRMLLAAAAHASLHLTEIEARAHFVDAIHARTDGEP